MHLGSLIVSGTVEEGRTQMQTSTSFIPKARSKAKTENAAEPDIQK